MSEVEKKEPENKEPEYKEEEVVEHSAAEIQAMERGWNPDKESVPEGKEWIPAEEFNRNETFFKEIHKLKREIKNQQKSFDVLKDHHNKVAVIAKEEALSDLKRQKKQALEDDDHSAVVEIDDKISDIKTQKDDPVSMQETDNQAFEAWIDENPWYESNGDMREIADDLGNAYFQRMGGKVSATQVFAHVEKQIKRIYPDNFKSGSKKTAPAVEGATKRAASSSKKAKFTERDLTDDQRMVMKRFVKEGVITKEKYIEELVSIGELS